MAKSKFTWEKRQKELAKKKKKEEKLKRKLAKKKGQPETSLSEDMAATKKENGLKFLNNAYNGYNIDYRENAVTLSKDFVINTGTAKIIIKIGQKRWDDSDNISIVEYLKLKEQQISEAVFNNQDEILFMK